jgi:hypothetical protein
VRQCFVSWADAQVAACVCEAWRSVIGGEVHSLCFTWAARGAPGQVRDSACAPDAVVLCCAWVR